MEIEDGCHNSQHRTLGKVSETTKLFEANQLVYVMLALKFTFDSPVIHLNVLKIYDSDGCIK